MSKKNSRRMLVAWWPLLVPRPNELWLDEFYMSLGILVATYLLGGLPLLAGVRALFLVVLLLYFLLIWMQIAVSGHLTRAEKCLAFVLQTGGALILTSPLIYLLFTYRYI